MFSFFIIVLVKMLNIILVVPVSSPLPSCVHPLPFYGYHWLHLTGSLAHRTRFLHRVIGSVTLPEPTVPTAVVALLHKPHQAFMLGLHTGAAQFQYLLCLTHTQCKALLPNIIICFTFRPIASAKHNSALAPGLSSQSGSRQMMSHCCNAMMSSSSISL